MHARMKADLYAAGFTSQENLLAMLKHTTDSAGPPRKKRAWGWMDWIIVAVAVVGLVVALRLV